MKNFIAIMEQIKKEISIDAYYILYENFMDAWRDELRKMKPCKSSTEKAIEKYVQKTATMCGEKTATYSDGITVLMIGKNLDCDGKLPRKAVVETATVEMLKSKRPVDCHFMESIALYKALKKQENKKYCLRIENRYYDAALIEKMIDCIAGSKDTYIYAEICSNGALFIQQLKTAAIILPLCKAGHNPTENVNFSDFMEYCDKNEKSFIDDIKASA